MMTGDGGGRGGVMLQGVYTPAIAQSSVSKPEQLDLLGMHGKAVTC